MKSNIPGLKDLEAPALGDGENMMAHITDSWKMEIREAFTHADTSRGGFLDAGEMRVGLCALGLKFDEASIVRCMEKNMGDLDAASWERIVSVQVHFREEVVSLLRLYSHPEEDDTRMEEE